MQYYKPESALTKATQLLNVDQKAAALDVLHGAVTNKRNRTWQQAMEDIMILYIDLCVELRKGKVAREGLINYKSISQVVNVASLGKVIEYFLNKAREAAQEAQGKADQIVSEIGDLDEATPESLLLESISGEGTKDRADREFVTPWLKFLWESYRTILDILRYNVKLEQLYQDTALFAFKFCKQFKRNNEFRRLCEILRNHLVAILRHKSNPPANVTQASPLSTPESLAIHLNIRFAQLKVATKLELWQEAFRSIEDIQGLMQLSETPLKPAVMAEFYQKLTSIFWVSNNHLFSSSTWFKLLMLHKTHKRDISQESISIMASHVLLGAMAIPEERPASYIDQAFTKERLRRMADLLGFSVKTSRTTFLAELEAKGVLEMVPDEVLQIYRLLELRRIPHQLVERLAPYYTYLETAFEGALAKYLTPLRQLSLLRVFQQLSAVYSSVSLAELRRIVGVSAGLLERHLIHAVRQRHIVARIDHRDGVVHFGGRAFVSDVPAVKTQLTQVAKCLKGAIDMIRPALREERQRRREELMQRLGGGGGGPAVRS